MVRVTPGMLPPTISTTPNSPSVCAKLRANPVTSPAFESGSTIWRNVCAGEWPSDAEARSSLASTAPNDAANGCTANGRLYNKDPITNPSNVKARLWPVSDSHQRPSGLREPRATRTEKPSTVGGRTKGSATAASTRNLQRQREYVSQYAMGIPMAIISVETIAARRTVSQKASQFIDAS